MKSTSNQHLNLIQKENVSGDIFDCQKFLPGLRSKDASVQLKTVRELYVCLLNELKQIKREEETSFIDSLMKSIKKLGNDRNDSIGDKQACILIITSIINLDNINVRVSKIHHVGLFILLRNLLSCSDPVIIQMASRAMGRLVMAGVECDVDFKTALENLRNDSKRYTGIICVRELALASQSRLFLNSQMFFEDIMMAITDKNANIRQEACELFRLSLHISISREVSIAKPDYITRELSLRRSSTNSSLTNSQDSLHSSIASSVNTVISTAQSSTTLPTPNLNDYYFTLQYKCCFENAIKELESCLNNDKKESRTQNRDEKIHGYLLMILEILKFSSLEFEKEIEINSSLYITRTHEIDNQIKSCEELHAKNLLNLLPYSFEPVNDPFLFLFKSEKITVKVESKNCRNLIVEKYDTIYSCISRLYHYNNIYIQQTLLQLIPRLANFDRIKFPMLYLKDCIKYLKQITSKKTNYPCKSEALFCVGLLSIAIGSEFLNHCEDFIDTIRLNPLFNVKESQKKRSGLSSSASLASIVSTVNTTAQNGVNTITSVLNNNAFISANAPITLMISKYGNLNNIASIIGTTTTNDELNSILACVAMFSKSMPHEMSNSVIELLEPLMLTSGGVTHTMRYCLDEISRWIPELKPAIHENLLKIISQILTGKPLCQIIQTVSTSATQLTNPIAQLSSATLNIPTTPHIGASTSNTSLSLNNDFSSLNSDRSFSTQTSVTQADKDLIIQALQTLRSFEFTTIYVIAFLRHCVDYYLHHESREVKIETVLTTSVLLNRLIKTIDQQDSRSLISMVSCSLRKLLDCALTDSQADVRYHILNSLNSPQFNMFVALPENLNILFMCVRDERVEIRELSASIISRLSVSSSAYILPFIRKILMQLLIEIEIYPDVTQKEISVRLVGHLLSYTPRLVNLYAKPLLDNLHKKLLEHRNDLRFASSIITIVGQLASQSGPETVKHFDSVIPFLIESMQDSYYIQLKHTSLWTIGQIIANTGYVIEPYKKYPSLLKILLYFLQNETNSPVRRETIRILGLIGAIDPFEYKKTAELKSSSLAIENTSLDTKSSSIETKPALEPSEMLMTMNTNNSTLDEYYPALAIHLLMKIIKDAIGIGPRKDAIQALVYAMRTLDNRCVNYVELVIPPFLELIKNMNDNLVIDLITQLSHLVTYFKKHVENYLPGIINVVEYYWNNTEKQAILIALIELLQSIVNVMNVEFKKYLPQIIPLVLKQLQREINSSKNPNVQKLLHLLRSCSCCIEFYVHLILTQFTEYLANKDVELAFKQEILYTIYTFAKQITLIDNCATLFQSFFKVLDQYLQTAPGLSQPSNMPSSPSPSIASSISTLTNVQKQNGNLSLPNSLKGDKLNGTSDIILLILEILYLIARQMGPRFFIYVPMFDKILLKNKGYGYLYERLVYYCKDAVYINVCNTHLSPAFYSTMTISNSLNDSSTLTHDLQFSPLAANYGNVPNAFLDKRNPTQAKLNETTSQPKQSVSTQSVQFSNLKVRLDKAEHLASRDGWRESFRRFMLSVVEEAPVSILRVCCLIAHDSVPPELFNACFISIWTNLSEKEQNEIVRYLELALKNSDAPDIIKTILNLAEFMERCDNILPVDHKLLAEKAFHVRAYAKSLHYVEEQFSSTAQPTSEILEQLVILNHELQRSEAASGVLDYANKYLKNLDMRVKERWYEKLHDWQKALNAYEKELNLDQPAALSAASANPTSFSTDPKTLNHTKLELLFGKMRCLKGLGDWNKLSYVCKDMLNCISQLSASRDDHHDDTISLGPSSFYSFLSPSMSSTTLPVNTRSRRQISTSISNDQQLHLTHQQQLNLKAKIAEMGAAASWGLSDWNSMGDYVKHLPEKSYEGSLYRAVLAIEKNEFSKSINHIHDTRDLLDGDLTSMASQSYDRAYQAIIEAQVLSELEEIIIYKSIPSKRESLHESWLKRLQGCEKSMEYWHRLLLVRSIVLPKEKDIKPWLKFSSLCQKIGHLNLSGQILHSLLSDSGGVDGSPANTTGMQSLNLNSSTGFEQCKYAYLKYTWAGNFRKEAYSQLSEFVYKNLQIEHQQIQQAQQNNSQSNMLTPNPREYMEKRVELERLLSKCFLKLGRWQYELEGMNDATIPQVISHYQAAKDYNKGWYKAWNAWAYANYEAIQYYKNNPQISRQSSRSTLTGNTMFTIGSSPNFMAHSNESNLNQYIKPAIQGFITCIKLSPGTALEETNCLQDTLRLLTLWFEYCNSPDLYETLSDGINSTPLEIWLQVIPQLIARIDTNKQYVAKLIYKLLIDLGRVHPQALVYRLILASKCPNTTGSVTSASAFVASLNQTARNLAAQKILLSLREHSNVLVEQAKLVSEELIRVAILWHELWHESLEDASKLYFAERNVNGMFETLEVLHNMMDKGASTAKETAFLQAYGRDLSDAREYCNRYKQNRNTKELELAWDKYYHVFKKITRQLPQMVSLELNYVAPKLKIDNELELAVPGTYEPNKPLIRIKSFNPNIQVIASKQRPRKISIYGSNGREYVFLLKGHEDLRQDERVMQIFGLVNNLLLKNHETARRDLAIQRYSVIPLSQNSGLLEWLMNCDTLHSLIREYRDRKKIALNIEHRIITKLAPDYEHLTCIQKVEIFETALDNSLGDDLAKILWYKSLTAEKWLERRTNYTRSLAVMSMVGYVLGLGDRHPSNLMLDRNNGKIIHVDFGDCFETAMTREKFPEKIPFRLTRMLKNAMEVTGIEGTFRRTCESVMKVLRNNRESVLAVLEAFVYDPLFSWRLVEGNNHNHHANIDNLNGDNINSQNTSMNDSDHQFISLSGSQLIDDSGEEVNRKALKLINRVKDKLTGHDFGEKQIDEKTQVDLLIKQATSSENLCQCFIGWCAWW